MKKDVPNRKCLRLRSFDYDRGGAYFITICTEKRKRILSEIVGTDVPDGPFVQLMSYGKIAEKYIRQLHAFYAHISVDRYVIMPDHIHLILFVAGEGPSGTSVPTKAKSRQHSAVSSFVSTFKRFCNKEYGSNIWQSHFYDHIIRDERDYEKHVKYIHENPLIWSSEDGENEEAAGFEYGLY